MVVTGNWVVPQLNYRTYYDKPALMYWLCAVSYSVFGVHEWAARLVPALCGMLTLAELLEAYPVLRLITMDVSGGAGL
jgi:4-amino-4-deoxy-L-arabinose transferase-like glycosyltransferase